MSNTSKIDAAAEKAYAEAAEKKAAENVDVKTVEKAVEADAVAPAKVEKVAKAVSAPKKAAPAKKAAPVKKAAPAKKAPAAEKKTVAKKVAVKKTAAKKPAAKKKTVTARKAAKPAAQPKTTIKSLKEKIMATKNTKTVADTVKSTAEDMQARFKTAFEKSNEVAGEAVEFTKGNVEALVESGKILASGLQDMGRDAVEDTRSAYSTMTEDVKKLASVSSPTEFFQLQGEMARKNFDTAVAQTSKNSEKLMKLANDAFAPVSNRVSVAVEKFSKAA